MRKHQPRHHRTKRFTYQLLDIRKFFKIILYPYQHERMEDYQLTGLKFISESGGIYLILLTREDIISRFQEFERKKNAEKSRKVKERKSNEKDSRVEIKTYLGIKRTKTPVSE